MYVYPLVKHTHNVMKTSHIGLAGSGTHFKDKPVTLYTCLATSRARVDLISLETNKPARFLFFIEPYRARCSERLESKFMPLPRFTSFVSPANEGLTVSRLRGLAR